MRNNSNNGSSAAMRATFVGTKPFPLEMLTRDECYPSTGKDVIAIIDSIRRECPEGREYEVTLARTHGDKVWQIDTWRLYGYKLKKLYIS